MTIASTLSRISYVGDASTTGFPVPFYFQANTDLVVYLTDLGGNTVLQVLGTNYNLTGATVSSGGTCTFTTAPASGYIIAIYRDPALTQTTSYNNNDPFPAKSHELALDKALTIDQRTRDIVSRSVHLNDADPAAAMILPTLPIRKGKVLGFSAADGSLAASNNTLATLDSVLSGALATSGGFNRIVLTSNNATLKAMTPFAGAVVYQQGYASDNDGGQGLFVWNASSTATPDNGLVVQPNAGGVGRWLRAVSGPIDLKWFGATGDGTTDDDAAWVHFHDYLSTNLGVGGRITKGIYKISSDLNWAIQHLCIETVGDVILKSSNVNYGLRFSGATSPYGSSFPTVGTWGIRIGRIRVQANAATTGILIDRCHHGNFELTCMGAVSNGIMVSGCVSTIFRKPTVSYNEDHSTLPTVGLVITGSPTTYNANCTFDTPIMEVGGTGTTGISIDYSVIDNIFGGTSEGNTQGLLTTANTQFLLVKGTDFEANTSYDVTILGRFNTLDDIQTQTSLILSGSGAYGNAVVGGSHGAILETAGATNNLIDRVRYNRQVNSATLTATSATKVNFAFNIGTGLFDIQAVTAPTLTNSWANSGAGQKNAGYFKSADGLVHLVGTVSGGTIGTAAFTLPAGFRPLTVIYFAVPNPVAGTIQIVAIAADGTVKPVSGTNTGCSFDGINFVAGA